MGSIQHMAREAIVGDAYPVKDQLRALGGRWNPDRKAWMVPADKAEEAKVLVNGLSVGAAPKLPSSKDSVENDGRGVVDQTTTLNGVTQHGIRPEDRIVIQYLDDNKTTTLTLSHERNDPTKGVLSVASPLGKQVLGLVEGDETEFRPRRADRTRSPAAVSQKREYFKCPPETIGDFAPEVAKFGAWRPIVNLQKPAIGGPFCDL